MNRSLVFDLATAAFAVAAKTHSSSVHLAQAIGMPPLGYRVIYRETHTLLEEIAFEENRKEHVLSDAYAQELIATK